MNQTVMTLFKHDQPQSFRFNMASHHYQLINSTVAVVPGAKLSDLNLKTIPNQKHLKFSFKHEDKNREGVAIISNLKDIKHVRDYYTQEDLIKHGDHTFYYTLREADREPSDLC